MRKIYLIRHGEPFFPGGDTYCIGTADFPLSQRGREQTAKLGDALRGEKLTVFTSPLSRAYDTALALSPAPSVIEELKEMHAGDWDGLSFAHIKERWSELYEARASNADMELPNAENWHEGQRRFIKGVEKALSLCDGDIAIVAHTTVILSFVCHIMKDEQYKAYKFRPDYGCFYLVSIDESGKMHCDFPWKNPVQIKSAKE